MKRIALGLIVAMAFILAAPARASSITGDVSLAGLDDYNATSITFTNPADVLTASGSLAIMTGFPTVTMSNIPNFASAAGITLFDWSNAGNTITMIIDSLTVVENNSTFLDIKGTATMTETGFSNTLYNWSLTSTTEGETSFTLDAIQTPEPGSLVLVGSGVIGLAWLLYWRARKPAFTNRLA